MVWNAQSCTDIRAGFLDQISILLGNNTDFSVAPPVFLTVTTVSHVVTNSKQEFSRSSK